MILWLTRIAARALANKGHTDTHSRIIQRTAQLRREVGLPPHPALKA
jgi:hypothetical protein